MREEYLGDSYDIVKRLWADLLREEGASLFTDPQFILGDIAERFQRVTGIGMLQEGHPEVFSILIDPDTGIHAPEGSDPRKYASIDYILETMRSTRAKYVVAYDQSFSHCKDEARRQSMRQKMRDLAGNPKKPGFPSFYYVSHAPFLFVASDDEALARLRSMLTDAGIPGSRLESL